MNAKWLYMGFTIVLAASLMTGCQNSTKATSSEGQTAAEVENAKPIAVSVATIKEGTLSDSTELMGEISANTNISILSKVPATLVQLSVKKGDKVKNGQVIGSLDQADYILKVKSAEAELARAQAQLKQAQSINSANSAGIPYDLAKRSLDLAQTQYDRTKVLFESGAVSSSQLEQAEAALLQAKMQLNLNEKSDAQSSTTVEVAQAGVKQAQVGVEMAKSALKDTFIKATADGIITDVMVEVGDAVNPQMPVATLLNFDPAIVRVNVTEQNLSRFKKDTVLEIDIPSQNKTLQGKVTYVGIEASSQSKMFPVEIEINNPDLSALPGMKVNVKVKETEGKKGLLVPTDAILEANGKNMVFVVEGDQAMKREVVLAEGNTSFVIVASGLSAGDKVVVKGHSQLNDQSKVRIAQ